MIQNDLTCHRRDCEEQPKVWMDEDYVLQDHEDSRHIVGLCVRHALGVAYQTPTNDITKIHAWTYDGEEIPYPEGKPSDFPDELPIEDVVEALQERDS